MTNLNSFVVKAVQAVTFLTATVLVASPSKAAILFDSSTTVAELDPVPTVFGNTRANKTIPKSPLITAFDEAQNVLVTRDIPLSNFDDWRTTLGVIPAGTRVNSHMVFYNNEITRPREGWPDPERRGRTDARATISFGPGEVIIGVLGRTSMIMDTNDLFGLSGVTYDLASTNLDQGWGAGTRDILTIVDDNTLDIFITSEFADTFRVITATIPGSSEPVPEPFTILGATTALGFGTFFKKKLGKNKSKEN